MTAAASDSPDGIPWELADKIACRLAGTYPLADSYHAAALAEQAPDMVRRAADMVTVETGLEGPGIPDVAVIGRQEWVRANVTFFAEMLAPAEERLADGIRSLGGLVSGSGRLAKRLAAAELGALLGVISRRVLGQYELVLPSADRGDTVFLIAPNILSLERANQFRPDEFRFWLALHESAHRLQFLGVPWMQDYFLGLVKELIATSEPERGRLTRVAGELRAAAAEGRPMIGETGVLGLMASPDQRDLLDRVQALMSLLEGHGHVVMDRIGARTLVTQKRMSRLIKRRRTDPRMAAFLKLTGMEMKLRQYELGEKFILGVEAMAGWQALDIAWSAPDALPTRAEIEDPQQWLDRVG
jgi:coenzyme F420 biosynthesis associated uncharacterized protein